MLLALCSMLYSFAFAEGLSGWTSINYNTTKHLEDGKKTSAQYNFSRNLYLTINKSITPVLYYQFNLRTNWLDSDFTDPTGKTTTTYQREVEPIIDFFLRNPMYDLSAGYRREEQWSTAHLRDESRETSEFYYSRFNLIPRSFPSLSLQFDRLRNYDHLPIKETDRTNTRYSINSVYELPSKDLKLRYNITYTHDVDETPIGVTTKSIYDYFSGTYNLGYSTSLWGGRSSLSVNYQGNYTRNKSQQFVSQTGNVLFERMPLGGLHAQGDVTNPEVGVLSSEVSLVDDDYNTGITDINIGTQKYHNIGIWVSSEKSINRLYIYVNKNVSTDTNLTTPSNWKAYRSNFNQTGTWTEIAIQAVEVTAYDIQNDIYRYEIEFSISQSASYFKIINMETINISGITDVLVTEIEAYGTDIVPQVGKISAISTFFDQRLDLSSHLKALRKLNFFFNYSINRADQSPLSLWDSISGIFVNIFSKSKAEEEDLESNITRTYGLTSTWMTHRLLTTTLRFQRDETFDNKNETDTSSNTYSLSFDSTPLPTLDTNLSLIRSDRYNFGERDSTTDSILLNIISKLYTDVNMVTDVGYTRLKSFITETMSSSYYINGLIDARFTQRLTGNFTYDFNWSSSDDISSYSKNGIAILTYQPGRFINLSGNFTLRDEDGDISTSEGFLMDWLPLPAIRLNINYQHTRSKPGPSISDSFNGYGIWYITKFANLYFSYGYTREVREKEMESYNFITNLNCRF